MIRRLTIVASIVALGLALGGCTKCGFWWDDWMHKPAKSCNGDWPND